MSTEVHQRVRSLILTPVTAGDVPSPGGNEIVVLSSAGVLTFVFSDGTTFTATKGQLSTTGLVLTGSSTITGGTSLALKVGAATFATITAAAFTIAAGVATPSIKQADAAADASGQALTIQAQNAGAKTANDTVGGDLVLAAGAVGSGSAGAAAKVILKSGATTLATVAAALASGVVKADGSNALTAATIVDADVSASAAIAGTKITPVSTIQTLTNETAAWTPGAGVVKVVNTSGTCTLNLPAPASYPGLKIELFITASPATRNVVLHRNASETIDGASSDKTITSASTRYVEILCDGTNWFTCSGNVA